MDVQKKLLELKEMHEKGLISATVYEEQQKALLADSVNSPRAASGGGLLDAKKNFRVLAWLAALVGAVAVGTWALYSASDQEGRDLVNRVVAEAGVARVIPWPDRAETAARQLVEANKQKLADSILGITHPTGTTPVLSAASIGKFNERIRVELVVDWKGGFLGGQYTTTVAWDIGEKDHIKAAIISDTASIPVEEKNKQALDEYFKSGVYPAFFKDMGG
jgi:hypothetical protein